MKHIYPKWLPWNATIKNADVRTFYRFNIFYKNECVNVYVYDTTIPQQLYIYSCASYKIIKDTLVFLQNRKSYMTPDSLQSFGIYNFNEDDPKTVYYSVRIIDGKKSLVAKIIKGKEIVDDNMIYVDFNSSDDESVYSSEYSLYFRDFNNLCV